jgi:hypothetical protein
MNNLGNSAAIERQSKSEENQIADDIRTALRKIESYSNKTELDEIEGYYHEMNKDFLKDCLILVLVDMPEDARKMLLSTKSISMFTVIGLAFDKLGMKEEKEKLKEMFSKISLDQLKNPSDTNLKLELGKEGGLLTKLQDSIAENINTNAKASKISGLLMLS